MHSRARLFPCLAFVFVVSVAPTSAESPIIAPDAKVVKVGSGYQFTEGPTADSNGDVYFTDQPNDRIVRYEFASGRTSDWLSPCGRSNGLYFVAPGQLIACADGNNELWRINIKDKTHQVLVGQHDGVRFNGPNDCWVDGSGAIYFTDPFYKRPYWTQEIPADSPRGVYRLAPDGTLSQVAGDFTQPNGIIGDDENKVLYVADIGARKTYKFPIKKDGSLGERSLFCESGSDGMTIDEHRNIYLTGSQGVTVHDPSGNLIETIPVRKGWTANVTFAGPDNDHLFITAGDAVYTIQMAVQGF
ncbi:MAG: SMP-30/gluconolactonase/LRE family protein [Phycisphaera sp. RhM]|nr:SMP-30/gluconolactonase/LRE family protein [Phycisphaera sp. RhM]